jgi:hypothetical protein
MMTPDAFRTKWRAEGDAMRRRAAMVGGADLCAELLADFELVMDHQDAAELALTDAARVSGYSADHLRRLYREGKLRGRRLGRRLLFRSADLPKKPEPLATGGPAAYDPLADARQVATRLHAGVTNG